MGKMLFRIFLVSLLIVFSCSGSEDKGGETKIPQNLPLQTISNRELKVQRNINKEESNTHFSSTDIGKNHPPEVTSISIAYVSDNNPRGGLRTVARAKDPDGDEVSFRYQWKRNGEKIIGAVGDALEWQDNFKKGDKISVEVIPYYGKDEGIWKAEGEFTIPNSPPRITSEPEAKMEGGKFRYAVKAEDPDGDPIEFTLKDAPRGMSIDPKTGIITWDFNEKDAGEYRVEVIASDPEGAKSSQILTLTIPKAK
ncbi:MAG: hypothetical protein C4291_02585 [Candidatus Dadabacteria bacterium]